MELGVSSSIAVKQLSGSHVDRKINLWLEKHPDVEVIDVKFSASASVEDWMTDALIIYRKEG